MITPRVTRLLRAPSARAFQRAIALASYDPQPFRHRDIAILVPSSGAVDQLRHTIEDLWLVEQWTPAADEWRVVGGASGRPGGRAIDEAAPPAWPRASVLLPEIVTRGGWYRLLYERLDERPPLLDGLSREVLFRRAALEAVEQDVAPPYDVRPGLVPEMLTLYDALRRQHKTIDDFERLVGDRLEAGADIDRGARRLLQQTRFLVAAFRAYEASLAGIDALDEHRLRDRLLAADCARPLRKLVVTIADQRADASGLWAADFDLITRLPHLEAIDIIATEAVLAAGFLERLLETLPEIELRAMPDVEAPAPVLLAPPADLRQDARHFVSRDREEELARVARAVRDPDRTAVVYQRPLPYLYLARQVFGAAGVPWQALDALPLAVEPFAAALDVVLTFVISGYTRDSSLALLRSPFFRFVEQGSDREQSDHEPRDHGQSDDEATAAAAAAAAEPSEQDIAACDLFLREAGYLGGRERLADMIERLRAREAADQAAAHRPGSTPRTRHRRGGRPMPALLALHLAAEALAPLEEVAEPGAHLVTLDAFLARFERALPADDALRERHLRARGAVLATIAGLQEAFTRYGGRPGPFRDVAALLHRWIEGQTFNPRVGQAGLHLVDVQTAIYGRFSRLFLVGVTEGEWPSSSARSIFYPGSLLRDLGWPGEADRRVTARAVFEDLLRLPRDAVSVSTFALENDAIVRPSPFVEDLITTGLPVQRVTESPRDAHVLDGALRTAVMAGAGPGETEHWRALRTARAGLDAPAYHGHAGPVAPRTYSVTGVDRYLQCPFKYFAQDVLRLQEEPDQRPGLTALERGSFEHEVFQEFFIRWQSGARGAITPELLDDARVLFEVVVDDLLERLPAAERELERVRLLGSAVIPGLGERVFRFEAARPSPIVERLLEYKLDGEYLLPVPDDEEEADEDGGANREPGESGEGAARERPREAREEIRVSLRGTTDRIDLLADGTMRLIDYKAGKASTASSSIQLPVYVYCAERRLDLHGGRHWKVGEAGYLAFGRQEPFVSVVAPGEDAALAVDKAIKRLSGTVGRIERGDFPVAPIEPHQCIFCGFAAVCRKDYVGD